MNKMINLPDYKLMEIKVINNEPVEYPERGTDLGSEKDLNRLLNVISELEVGY